MALTDKQIQAAYPHSTQTIEIEAFVKNDEIPFVYLAPTQLRRADQQGGQDLCAAARDAAQDEAFVQP